MSEVCVENLKKITNVCHLSLTFKFPVILKDCIHLVGTEHYHQDNREKVMRDEKWHLVLNTIQCGISDISAVVDSRCRYLIDLFNLINLLLNKI